jgi:hypothetical protein
VAERGDEVGVGDEAVPGVDTGPITSRSANSRLDSQWERTKCQIRSAGFSSGLYGGNKMMVMLSGTTSWPLRCQAAPAAPSPADPSTARPCCIFLNAAVWTRRGLADRAEGPLILPRVLSMFTPCSRRARRIRQCRGNVGECPEVGDLERVIGGADAKMCDRKGPRAAAGTNS